MRCPLWRSASWSSAVRWGLSNLSAMGLFLPYAKYRGSGSFSRCPLRYLPVLAAVPVVNMEGKVVGVATFQFLEGQNLNFAIAGKSILDLKTNKPGQTLSEWTYSHSNQKPRLAGELCRKGFSFSIKRARPKSPSVF